MTDQQHSSLIAEDEAWISARSSDELDKERFRMPVGFGRAPGPRNHPLDKVHFATPNHSPAYSVVALTDGDLLRPMLPPGVEIRGEPRIEAKVLDNRNAFWLAGRHYEVLIVGVPVTNNREGEGIDGNYYLAEWHTVGDNVVTAREELGWPALWADVSEPRPHGTNAYSAHASWLGFRFFEMELTDLGEPHDADPVHDVQMTYKYIPVGYSEGAEVSRLIVNDRTKYWSSAAAVKGIDSTKPEAVGTVREGKGNFQFFRARWEDMPTQYNVVNALARLPLEPYSAQVYDMRFL